MKLVIGLGNIGTEYERTRHNVGFMCLKQFAENHGLKWKKSSLFYHAGNKDYMLIMPSTFMNNSGKAYISAISKYQPINQVLIISDDLELPLGKLRIRTSGGDGGHNGLKSIFAAAGTNDIPRLRIGIGRSDELSARDFVLDSFSEQEKPVVETAVKQVCDWLETFIQYDLDRMLDEYSKYNKKPIPPREDGIKDQRRIPND